MQVLGEPLFYIFFIYGLSFLALAFLVFKGTAGSRSVPLIAAFDLLAAFGVTHGITEMTDWVRFIRKTVGQPESTPLAWLSQVCLVLSFVVLLQFGINLLTAQWTSKFIPVLRLIPSLALIVFVGVIVEMRVTNILTIGLLGRYTFGFASAALAAIALVASAKALEPLGDSALVRGLYVAAIAFVAYAVFGGLIVKPIGGVPIQMFRAACAVTIALSCFLLIRLSSTVASGPRELSAEGV